MRILQTHCLTPTEDESLDSAADRAEASIDETATSVTTVPDATIVGVQAGIQHPQTSGAFPWQLQIKPDPCVLCVICPHFLARDTIHSSIVCTKIKMKFASILATTAALVATTTAQIEGGWGLGYVDDGTTYTLILALTQHPADYESSVTTRICVRKLVAVEKQLVAGMNYRFHVLGVPVDGNTTETGWCDPSSTSDVGLYEIDVFSQLWTKTLRVMAITAE